MDLEVHVRSSTSLRRGPRSPAQGAMSAAGRCWSSATLLGESPRWVSEVSSYHPEGRSSRPSYTLHLPGDAWLDPTQADDSYASQLGGCNASPPGAAKPFSSPLRPSRAAAIPDRELVRAAASSPASSMAKQPAGALAPPYPRLIGAPCTPTNLQQEAFTDVQNDYLAKPSLEFMLRSLRSPGTKPSAKRGPAALPPLESLGLGTDGWLEPAAGDEPAAPTAPAVLEPEVTIAATEPSELYSSAGQENQALSAPGAKR